MIPYVEVPAITFGRWQINVFGLLAAIAIGVGYYSLVQRVRRLGYDVSLVPGLVFWILIAGIGGGVLFKFVIAPTKTALGASLIAAGGASFGALTAGLAGGCIYLWWAAVRGLTLVRYLDALAFVVPRAWAVFRLGCALVHDHPGARTTSWLGVQFPGGPRFDLGLIELLGTLGCLAVLTVLDRVRWPVGFYSGLLPLAYAIWRLVLDPLRESRVRHLGWTLEQYLAFAIIAISLAVLAISFRRAARNAEGLPLPTP